MPRLKTSRVRVRRRRWRAQSVRTMGPPLAGGEAWAEEPGWPGLLAKPSPGFIGRRAAQSPPTAPASAGIPVHQPPLEREGVIGGSSKPPAPPAPCPSRVTPRGEPAGPSPGPSSGRMDELRIASAKRGRNTISLRATAHAAHTCRHSISRALFHSELRGRGGGDRSVILHRWFCFCVCFWVLRGAQYRGHTALGAHVLSCVAAARPAVTRQRRVRDNLACP